MAGSTTLLVVRACISISATLLLILLELIQDIISRLSITICLVNQSNIGLQCIKGLSNELIGTTIPINVSVSKNGMDQSKKLPMIATLTGIQHASWDPITREILRDRKKTWSLDAFSTRLVGRACARDSIN